MPDTKSCSRSIRQSISSVGASALVTGHSAPTSSNGSKMPLALSGSSRRRWLNTRNAIGWTAFFADTSTAPPSHKLGDVTYYNCGDWVETCSALVEHFDGRVEIVRKLDERTL